MKEVSGGRKRETSQSRNEANGAKTEKTSQNTSKSLSSSIDDIAKSNPCARKISGDEKKLEKEKKEEVEKIPCKHHDRGSHISPSRR